jgi:Ni,Fe-hydrogenase III small subunit
MPLKEINILRRHGRQYVPDLREAVLPEIFRGRPVISNDITPAEADLVKKLCPVGAMGVDPAAPLPGSLVAGSSGTEQIRCTIDLGKCVFCRECAFALPGKISFTNDYKMATNVRDRLIVASGNDKPIQLDPDKVRREIRSLFKHALKLRQVSAAGDNSAEMELNAAGNVNFDMGRYGIEFVASPRHADGLVITGLISLNMAEPLQICYDAIPSPKMIILTGTDAISGGIFSGSAALNREFLTRYPVDLYVPGNPPHPLTFINGILDLIGRR